MKSILICTLLGPLHQHKDTTLFQISLVCKLFVLPGNSINFFFEVLLTGPYGGTNTSGVHSVLRCVKCAYLPLVIAMVIFVILENIHMPQI